jgi:hypothetical protein
VSAKSEGLATVSWVGSVRAGPWRARAVSLNDCPADARVVAGGIVLQYPRHKLVLPHGGGPLEKRLIRRPAFAERMELMPLGLAFGAADPKRTAALCSTGWQLDNVMLDRIPPGTYTILWMGDGLIHEVPITVEPTPAGR